VGLAMTGDFRDIKIAAKQGLIKRRKEEKKKERDVE
jgi:hypothetical protein